MSKIENLQKQINDNYTEKIKQVLEKKFGKKCGFETRYSIFQMAYVTTWKKSLPAKLKKEIKAYIAGYSDGYADSMNQIV